MQHKRRMRRLWDAQVTIEPQQSKKGEILKEVEHSDWRTGHPNLLVERVQAHRSYKAHRLPMRAFARFKQKTERKEKQAQKFGGQEGQGQDKSRKARGARATKF
eukprot:1146874-Pelagomonas_calceolata.AAC.2